MRRAIAVAAAVVLTAAAAVAWLLFDRHATDRLAAARSELTEALRDLEPERPMHPSTAGPTVADVVREASAAVVPVRDVRLRNTLQGLHEVPSAEWLPEERARATGWLEGQGEALSVIERLAGEPLLAGSWGEDLPRESLGVLRLALLIGLEARSSLAGGEVERPLLDVAALFAMARSLCAEPEALALTLGSGIERLALADVRDLLASGLWRGAALEELAEVVGEDPCAGAVEAVYRVESERLRERDVTSVLAETGPLTAGLRRPWEALRRARVLESRTLELEHLDETYDELLRRHDEAFRGAGDGSIVELVDIAGAARAIETSRRIAALALARAMAWPEPSRLEPVPTPYTGETPVIEARDDAIVLDLPESRRFYSEYEEDAPRGRADTLFRWTIRLPPAGLPDPTDRPAGPTD